MPLQIYCAIHSHISNATTVTNRCISNTTKCCNSPQKLISPCYIGYQVSNSSDTSHSLQPKRLINHQSHAHYAAPAIVTHPHVTYPTLQTVTHNPCRLTNRHICHAPLPYAARPVTSPTLQTVHLTPHSLASRYMSPAHSMSH